MEKSVSFSTDELLPHSSVNQEAETTVLLIHGACVDRDDWDLVIPHLKNYHLLVPDQIGHGEARHIRPYTLDNAASTIAQLIKQRGHDGVAHVVGHSLGASVALRLAAKHPEVVSSMVVSGVCKLERTRFTPYLPYAVWVSQRVENVVPRAVTRWLMDGADIGNADLSLCTLDFNKQIFGESLSSGEWPGAWAARTLVIAATKKGILPTDDNVEVAKTVAEIGRRLDSETIAVAHSGMRHPWNRQDPKLFADVIKAWVEGTAVLPAGFQRLTTESSVSTI
ncbi:Putative alpha/beta hydrolase-1 [Septoria linicola]|uniref:Alpha/beta hydrolase-1 n=1 Tax=Septoria linicola TaxID=215465 RepID=A0A9Q9EQI5_9PEZI|nr:Putative alpha/beta hydrolase-1 [Septoria linicola]